MSLKLPTELSSSQDLRAVTNQIRGYAHWLERSNVELKVTGKESEQSPAVSQAAAQIIKDWHGPNKIDRHSLDELMAALEDCLQRTPRIYITLAAPPSGELKKTLVDWCRRNIDPSILVEIDFNSTILGGMAVRFGSHIYDWSFRRAILENRSNFPEVLRRV